MTNIAHRVYQMRYLDLTCILFCFIFLSIAPNSVSICLLMMLINVVGCGNNEGSGEQRFAKSHV